MTLSTRSGTATLRPTESATSRAVAGAIDDRQSAAVKARRSMRLRLLTTAGGIANRRVRRQPPAARLCNPCSSAQTRPALQHQDDQMTATSRMTTAEATVAALLAHGIDTIYALPGVHNDHLFDALYKVANRMRTVHARHEQAAAYMALGAALATAKPQAYTVVPGPGLLNSGAALLT